MNADHFKVLSYRFLKYQFLAKYRTNQPLRLTTISIVGGQTNNIQPNWAAIEPNGHSMWSKQYSTQPAERHASQ